MSGTDVGRDGLRSYFEASLRGFGGIGGRALAQAAVVLLLARVLGPSSYGRFVTVLAVAGFLMPLVGLGAAGIVLREESRTPGGRAGLRAAALGLWWRTLCFVVPLGGVALFFALPPPFPLRAGLFLLAAEVAASSLVELLARGEQARGHLGRYGIAQAGLVWTRLLVLVALAVWLGAHRLALWMIFYGVAGIGYAGVLGLLVLRPRPRRGGMSPWGLARQSWPFAAGSFGHRLQNEFNKPVLAYSGFGDVARLNVAQRAVDVVVLPLLALQEALWPRLYRSGGDRRRLRRLLAALLGTAVLAGVGLRFVLAPLVPLVLGTGFAGAARLLGLLALLPLFQVLRNTSQVLAAARGRMRLVAGAAGAGAAAGVVFSLVLIPRDGSTGAVAALYGAELATVLVYAGAFLWHRNGETSG